MSNITKTHKVGLFAMFIAAALIGSVIAFDDNMAYAGGKNKKSNDETNLIIHEHPESAILESFRALRTGIQYSSLDKPIKTLMVTSAVPGEGKTTVLSNLGIVMAQAGKKVLLIESDLRKSDLHRFFKLENSAGLTNLLLDEFNTEELIQISFIPNLYLLASGPAPPDCSALHKLPLLL